MLISSKPFPVLLLCVATLALAAGAYGAEPPADEAVAEAETAVAEAGTAAASSVVAWDADRKVFVTPTDHEARRVAEDLRLALENTSYFSTVQDKAYALETIRPGLVRKRVGIEGLSVYRLRMGDDGMPVSACVQPHAEAQEPASSEGWVER